MTGLSLGEWKQSTSKGKELASVAQPRSLQRVGGSQTSASCDPLRAPGVSGNLAYQRTLLMVQSLPLPTNLWQLCAWSPEPGAGDHLETAEAGAASPGCPFTETTGLSSTAISEQGLKHPVILGQQEHYYLDKVRDISLFSALREWIIQYILKPTEYQSHTNKRVTFECELIPDIVGVASYFLPLL